MKVGFLPALRWLKAPQSQEWLREYSASSLSDAATSLAPLVKDVGQDEVEEKAVTLLYVITYCLLAAHTPAEATALSSEWNLKVVRGEAEKTRLDVSAARDAVIRRMDAGSSFESSLQTLPPLLAEDARQLRAQWPGFERVVIELSATQERAALLRQWSDALPHWLSEAPSGVLCWLGTVAGDYGAPQAAVAFYQDGLGRGAFPRSYWATLSAVRKLSFSLAEAVSELERLAADLPLAAAYIAAHEEDWERAERLISEWKPQSPRDEALKGVFGISIQLGKGDRNGAIARAQDAWRTTGSTGAALLAAQLLLVRAVRRGSSHRFADTEQALHLAIRVRDERRKWFGDSAEAVLTAVRAAILSENADLAWRISQPTPDGEAWPSEVGSKDLTADAALAAAITGRVERARELASLVQGEYVRAHIAATLTERSAPDGAEQTQEAWRKVWEVAETDEEKLQAAMGMAGSGIAPPDLRDLSDDVNAEFVEELQAIGSVVAAGSGDIASLRANVSKSRLLAIQLSDRYFAEGNVQLAAETLRESAIRWGDPRLMSMAAERFREAGNPAHAREAAQASLDLGGAGWGGVSRVRAMLLEIEAADGRWDKAADVARLMIAENPEDVDAHWALVQCLFNRGDLDSAWQALTINGAPFEPRSRVEALLWLNLNSRFSRDSRFVGEALRLMKKWPGDEQLLAAFLGLLYTGVGRRGPELSEEDLEALRAATQEFVEEFPESPHFRMMRIGPESNPLEPFEEDLRQAYEAREDVFKRVQSAELPLGMASSVTGRSMAEVSISRAAGFVFAVDPGLSDSDRTGVRASLQQRVMIDATALHSLVLLDGPFITTLLGTPLAVLTTDEIYKDALEARDSLAARSTVTMVWDPAQGRGGVSVTSDDDLATMLDRARGIVQMMEGLSRIPWPELRQFRDLSNMPWLNGVDAAAEHQWVYWSDDVLMRKLATSMGIPSFGTVALIEHLHASGVFLEAERVASLAKLVSNFYVDIEFSAPIMELAAASDGWQAKGAASYLSRVWAWRNPTVTLNFLMAALARTAGNAEQFTAWLTSASIGLVKIAGSEQDASSNLETLLTRTIVQSWLGPAQLAAAIKGVRFGLRERSGVPDPLPRVLRSLYGQMVDRAGYTEASHLLMSLLSAADGDAQALAARTILTYSGRGGAPSGR
ncbi:tetratricopeptide repeat protein [Micromonospora sp. NPDC049497]|uniref:tetratricopeptide repeat protein n=1 Tax=Micromonospora sp. NPDC049497 TaxID=3364273 RepID=UPI0037AF8182